jgi:Tol biopolymer transport system component/Ser/Thr protein kinase RdoA (MazF antagonist)
MAIAAGMRLGPYEVVAALGAGGMGEVWRGRDTRLEREVAIKILPAEFAANAQLRARFDREAKTISQLNHANVCTLFDVGQYDGVDFLVMELIEGESLADRLAKGRMPIDLVLRHGAEIASALDAAHRQGIVHRDLKPGNVMLTKSGAKLLDFGLAKSGPLMTSSAASVSVLANHATEHRPLTEQGTILGTFQYMSPEQLEGLEADARSDIFAFGALLYEMATGRRAFQGKNKTSLIAAIVSSTPPPVSEIAPLTPPALDHVIRRCLAKDPEDRWQSIRDVADQLQWIGEAGSRAGEAAPVTARKRSKLRLAWALHGLTAIAATALTLGAVLALRDPPRILRTSMMPPGKVSFDPVWGAPALSPDGRRIAFVGQDETGKRMLWVRPLDALTGQPLAGTEGVTSPFWSPDSRFLGFFSTGKLRRIDVSGGPPQALCDAADPRGGSWSANGTIVFAPSTDSPIYRVPAAGGTPVKVTELDAKRGETSHRHPYFLPDGEHFLFLNAADATLSGPDSEFLLSAGSLGSKEHKPILRTESSARYSKTGHLLFQRERTLLAQTFDPKTLELSGEAVPVAEDMNRTVRWETIFSVSDDGLLVYQSGPATLSQLVWVDREGRDLGTAGKPAEYGTPRLSNDGKRVAVSITDPITKYADVWVIDLVRGTATRLTFDPKDDQPTLWSPDDRYVIFSSQRQGRGDVFRKSSSGTGEDEVIIADPQGNTLTGISADGRIGAFMTRTARGDWDISIISMEDRKISPLLTTPFNEINPALTSDGRFIAYQCNESGETQIYVRALGPGGGKWQISTDGGTRAVWVQDRELIYQSRDNKLMVVDVTLAPEFSASVPRLLADPHIRPALGRQFDVSRDGQRILVSRQLDDTTARPLTLVQNWNAALER